MGERGNIKLRGGKLLFLLFILPRGCISTPQWVPALIIPGLRQAIWTKSEISGQKIGFAYEIGRADEVTKACYVFRCSLQFRPGWKKNAKEDGWNEEKYNTAMEHDVRRLKESGESETEVIVFGWFLLDFVPTKLNKFSGIGRKRDDKMWWKERRYRWKSGEERKRQKESVIPQRSITRHCELWYLLHQVPCGFIALGQCFEKERDY